VKLATGRIATPPKIEIRQTFSQVEAARFQVVIVISRRLPMPSTLDGDVYSSLIEIAQAEKTSKRHVSRILRLTPLAPDIVEAILGGWADQRVMLERLERPLSVVWEEQRTLLLARREYCRNDVPSRAKSGE
jgi:hypothetical protein